MYVSPDQKLTGATMLFKSAEVCKLLNMEPGTLRQWRSRGYLMGNDTHPPGKHWFFHSVALCHVAIVKELSDLGLSLVFAEMAACVGADYLFLNMLANNPQAIMLSAFPDDIEAMAKRIWADPRIVREAFCNSLPESEPYNFLMTDPDDGSGWIVIDDLDVISDPDNDEYETAAFILNIKRFGERMGRTLGPVCHFQQEGTETLPKDQYTSWLIGVDAGKPTILT